MNILIKERCDVDRSCSRLITQRSQNPGDFCGNGKKGTCNTLVSLSLSVYCIHIHTMYHRAAMSFFGDPFYVLLCVQKDRKESHVIHYSIKRAGEKGRRRRTNRQIYISILCCERGPLTKHINEAKLAPTIYICGAIEWVDSVYRIYTLYYVCTYTVPCVCMYKYSPYLQLTPWCTSCKVAKHYWEKLFKSFQASVPLFPASEQLYIRIL